MKEYRVSVNVVRCCDVYVHAEDAEDAKKQVLEDRLWHEEPDDAWCDGHEHTAQIDACVEVDEDGSEIEAE